MPKYEDFFVFLKSDATPEKYDQLSALGLSLLMAIIANEQDDENQPVVADCIASLKKITCLIDDSEPGTEITVIFTTEKDTYGEDGTWFKEFSSHKEGNAFGSLHKTTCKLRKLPDGNIEVDHLDSISTNHDYIFVPNLIILKALLDNARRKHKAPSKLISKEPDFPVNPAVKKREFNGKNYVEFFGTLVRQEDNFSCAVYAVKDGRLFTRGFVPKNTGKKVVIATRFGEYEYQTFFVPLYIMRSSQSAETIRHLQAGDLSIPVNRKGMNLGEFLYKYREPKAYIKKFSDKFLSKVIDYLSEHSMEEANAMLQRFYVQNFTVDDIARINAARLSARRVLS